MTRPYPTGLAERQAERTRIRQDLHEQADAQAHRVSRSLVCASDTRHETCVGAAGCLCPCHDPEETP